MSVILKVFLAVLLIIQTILVIRTLKKTNISIKYATVWLFMILIMALAVVFPGIIFWLADFFGFEVGSNMVFLIGFFFAFYVLFLHSMSISKNKNKIVHLTQEISLLKKELDKKRG